MSDTYRAAFAVTPHVSNPVPGGATRAITVGATGTVTGRMSGNAADFVFTATAGFIYPFEFTHIRATGTTATGIIALY